jgi:sugar phosphate isomerase/epimerase
VGRVRRRVAIIGYDGPLSIENEDPYSRADGVREAAAFILPLIG